MPKRFVSILLLIPLLLLFSLFLLFLFDSSLFTTTVLALVSFPSPNSLVILSPPLPPAVYSSQSLANLSSPRFIFSPISMYRCRKWVSRVQAGSCDDVSQDSFLLFLVTLDEDLLWTWISPVFYSHFLAKVTCPRLVSWNKVPPLFFQERNEEEPSYDRTSASPWSWEGKDEQVVFFVRECLQESHPFSNQTLKAFLLFLFSFPSVHSFIHKTMSFMVISSCFWAERKEEMNTLVISFLSQRQILFSRLHLSCFKKLLPRNIELLTP